MIAITDKATGGPLRDPWAALEGVTFNPAPQPVEAAPAKPLGPWRRFWSRIRAAFHVRGSQ